MPDFSSLSDEELLSVGSPDSDTLAELVRRYKNMVFGLARRFSRFADFEELVSDGLCAFISAAGEYKPERGSFGALAYVSVKNSMKNTVDRTIKHYERLVNSENTDEELEKSGITVPSPEDVFLEKEAERELYEMFSDELTPLELRCLEGVILGFGYEEIASHFGIDKKSA
ncbi:MAG: RNA polymerase sigma factor, partial [Oscillospiraceae bacterium]